MNEPDVKAVSHRNHFWSVQEVVDLWHQRLGVSRTGLFEYSESLLHYVYSSFEVAAGKAIEQAMQLILDPEFYQTKKARHAHQRQRRKEQKVNAQVRRLIDSVDPEVKRREIARIEHDIGYYYECIDRLKAQRKKLADELDHGSVL